MDAVIAKQPAILTLAGQKFVILPPTPRDKLVAGDRMRESARAKCISPLDYVFQHIHLPAAALAIGVSEAIKLGSGNGGVKEPTDDAVWAEYTTLEGVRWRVWYHISRIKGDFTPEQAAELVTADNKFDAADALDAALKEAILDPKGERQATGTSS